MSVHPSSRGSLIRVLILSRYAAGGIDLRRVSTGMPMYLGEYLAQSLKEARTGEEWLIRVINKGAVIDQITEAKRVK